MSLRIVGPARLWAAAAPLAAAAVLAATASAQYPKPPPDFSHPGAAPHDPGMTPASGTDGRPLLVIRTVYTNVSEAPTANAVTRYFGAGRGSVAHYFSSESFGRFTITPASENEGTTRTATRMSTNASC